MEGIKDFPIDHWIRKYAPICKVQLHGSSAPIVSINELKKFHPDTGTTIMDFDLALDYGPFEGSAELRERVAALHSTPEHRLDAENVIITPGSILANFLILDALCQPGDHIICQYPVFSQLHLLPQHRGVEVTSWQLMNDDTQDSISVLRGLIQSNTKAMILNNPNNPTGAVITKEMLVQIIDMAREVNATVFSDEVFQPLVHNSVLTTCPLVSLGYERSISSGSLSKVYGLPGVRVGWVVSPSKDLLRKILTARDYTTTTVSRLDDAVAAFSLDPKVYPNILKHSLECCREGIALIDAFVQRNNTRCSWSTPNGGATAFVCFYDEQGHAVDDTAFCAALAEEEGLCVIPAGWCFRNNDTDDFKGYCRFPLGNPSVLRRGLPILETFLNRYESHNGK